METEAHPSSSTLGLMRGGLALIRRHWRGYLAAHIAYYAVLIIGMGIVFLNPGIRQTMADAIGQAVGEGGPLSAVGDAYLSGRILPAIGLTFVINLFIGTLVSITLPSLIIPFSGWLVAFYRALLWGFIFAPPTGTPLTLQGAFTGFLIALLLLLEGEAYVIGMFGAGLQGRALLSHRQQGYETAARGYLAGLRETALLYVPIVVVLLIAAIYEVGISTLLMSMQS